MSIPVVFYVPNILCYARIVLAFVGLYCSIASLSATFAGDIDTNNASVLYAAPSPGLCIWIWILSAFLDLFDGLAARRLMQCSKFGVFLDILADNILRTVTWTATAIVAVLSTISDSQSQSGANWRSTTIVLVACGIVCLEWATMLCTQMKSAEDGRHWKAQNGSMASWYLQSFEIISALLSAFSPSMDSFRAGCGPTARTYHRYGMQSRSLIGGGSWQ